MDSIARETIGHTELLMGNSAFARGCLEAGIGFATGYPGTPSTEIIEELIKAAKYRSLYVEWSTNEKVAVESAAAAAFSGVRSVSVMKHNGLNVATDFIVGLSGCGTVAGLVLIVCDDPGCYSSNNERDSRTFAKWLYMPILEPMNFQVAKDMTKWAFELSEELKSMVLIRGQTRIGHSRGSVGLGQLPKDKYQARFAPPSWPIANTDSAVVHHRAMLNKLEKAAAIFESSPFNSYIGPESPELLVITTGICHLHTTEAVKALKLDKSVGILTLGTVWPLPQKLIKRHLSQSKKVLFVENVDPFIEDNVKGLAADWVSQIGSIIFYGKHTGHMNEVGEVTVTTTMEALSQIADIEYIPCEDDYDKKAQSILQNYVPPRGLTFCPGCPYRATFWTVKNVLKLVGDDGFCTGDIGCYALAVRPTGYEQLKTLNAMGSGAGMACGFGKLGQFGFNQPVLAVCGDSTFYHATIPAMINAVYNQSYFTLLVLDNSATAMTGFQPHPGTGKNATGPAPMIEIEAICRSLGLRVEVIDPFDIKKTTETLLEIVEQREGIRVLIMRRECEQIRAKTEEAPPYARVYIDPDKCYGDDCGCNRLCTRVFKCPGIIWNRETQKAEIDKVVCTRCGFCTEICPQSAIVKKVS
ncbi:thiamine pyrophosphate-dependent enzyme [Chloroflexota bacterium]